MRTAWARSRWTARFDLDQQRRPLRRLLRLLRRQRNPEYHQQRRLSNTTGYIWTGTVAVDGAGSKWTNSGSLYIGSDSYAAAAEA